MINLEPISDSNSDNDDAFKNSNASTHVGNSAYDSDRHLEDAHNVGNVDSEIINGCLYGQKD